MGNYYCKKCEAPMITHMVNGINTTHLTQQCRVHRLKHSFDDMYSRLECEDCDYNNNANCRHIYRFRMVKGCC